MQKGQNSLVVKCEYNRLRQRVLIFRGIFLRRTQTVKYMLFCFKKIKMMDPLKGEIFLN